jgi:UDP-N-acetylglucosamine 4-epimerase
MPLYSQTRDNLVATPRTWLITGVAGFIGSNLLEALLKMGQTVVGLDNFATGHQKNLDDVETLVGPQAWNRFTFHEADIVDLQACHKAVNGVEIVLHQAALGSVPRSLEDPLATHASNIDGFVNMLVASRDAGVKRFVYAASSSTYGDEPNLPKREDRIGQPLSPYAVTKYVNELYANVFARCYGIECIGLRYFNVFGPRQDPNGAYAAVIPRWIGTLMQGEACRINGDGETSRDFCFIDNTVQANLLAAAVENQDAINQVYNVAVGDRTSLNQLFESIRTRLCEQTHTKVANEPVYADFRPGDVRHSQADIAKARQLLGYEPTHTVSEGIVITCDWFLQQQQSQQQ